MALNGVKPLAGSEQGLESIRNPPENEDNRLIRSLRRKPCKEAKKIEYCHRFS